MTVFADLAPPAAPATLGQGVLRAYLRDTLSANVWELNAAKIRYTRRLGVGDATVIVPKRYAGDGVVPDPAGLAESWGYMVEITRQLPGQQPTLEFLGPVTGWGEVGASTTINASDLLGWFTCPKARTRAMYDDDASVVVQTVLLDAVTLRRAFIDTWVLWDVTASSIPVTVEIVGAHRRDVLDVLRDVLDAAVDLTCAGRTVTIRGQRNQAVTVALEDRHILGELRTWEDGHQFADIVYVLGAGSVFGQYPTAGDTYTPRGPIPVEVAVNRSELLTVTDCNRAAWFEWVSRSGLPVQVDVPSGGRLSPDAPVRLADLVPGTLASIRLDNRHHPLVATMRLTEVTVTQGSADGAARAADGAFVAGGNAADEQVSVAMTPMNAQVI